MKNKDNLSEFFANKDDWFNQHPPERVWNRLEARLQAERRTTKRLTLKWLRTFSIAASLTGLFLITVWLVSRFEQADAAFGKAVAIELIEPDFGERTETARLQYDKVVPEGEEGRALLTKEEAELLQRKLIYQNGQ